MLNEELLSKGKVSHFENKYKGIAGLSTMKYSIIIPAFNAEKTLERCLESIVHQIPANAELILINDGSSDCTECVSQKYMDVCNRIRYISKPNGGVSSARNLGLDNAVGEYVIFVDSDDAISEDYFCIIDNALQESPDLLVFERQLMGEKRRSCCIRSRVYNGMMSCSRVLSDCLRRQKLNLITTKAFRRDIIETENLRFDERLDIGEDKAFSFAFALCSTKVKMISAPLYCLSMDNPESLSRKKRDYLCRSVLLEHRLMSDLLQKAQIPKECKKLYQPALCYSFFRSAYTVAGELRKYEYSSKERRDRIRGILESYSSETGYDPKELYCRFISLPIRKKQAALVDFAMRFFYKRGNR